MCLDFNNDGNLFAVGGNDKIVKLYDDNTKSLIAKLESKDYKNPGHSNRIFAVKFLEENDNIIISGGWDNTLKIYDIREKGFVGNIYGPHICGDSLDVKDNKILTGSWATENQIQIFDLRNFKPLLEFDFSKMKYEYVNGNENENYKGNLNGFSEGNSSYLYSSKFAKFDSVKNNDLFGVAGSNDNLFGCFDFNNNNDINNYNTYNNLNLRNCMISKNNLKSAYSIDFSNKNREFAVGSGGDGKIHIITYKHK